MLTKGGALDIEAFDRRLCQAVNQAMVARAVRERRDLEIRLHPYDLEDLEVAPQQRWGHARTGGWAPPAPASERRWRDIPIVGDVGVAQGSPELRSAWRIVL